MLEYCIREDLKLKKARTMAVLNPVKLVIDNYPEDQIEMLEVQNNLENPELGSRRVPFGRELYLEAEKFHLEGKFTSTVRTLWKNHQRNTSVCSRAMKSA